MKKQTFVLLLLVLLMVGNALAETFTTPINITLNNNTATVITENWANTYYCNQTSTNYTILNIQRNFSDTQLTNCQSSLGSLNTTIQILTDSLKDVKAYYPLYTQCYANLTSCHDKNEGFKNISSDNAVLQSKYDSCGINLNAVTSDKKIVDANLLACAQERAAINAELKHWETEKFYWLVVGGLIVAVGAYFKYEKGWGKMPIEKEFPGKA